MRRPGLAGRHDLLQWANTIGASSEFPRMIRRLILETGASIVQIGFPAGEGVRSGGWDGTVRVTESTPFIPAGLSLWELSVDKSPGTKADEDYSKRVDTPDGTPTSECTYVAAILRPWADRTEWATRRTSEGRWKEVRAYGVDDIETWLEQAPVTQIWLSEYLGLNPHGVESAEWWWQTWSRATTPNLSPELVLAGRTAAAQGLRSRLTGTPQVTSVKGGSIREILAFIVGVAHGDPHTGEGHVLQRVVFVHEETAWKRLVREKTPLVLVPLHQQMAQEIPPGPPHHFIVPVLGAADADIILPPIDSAEATALLRSAGLDEQRATEVGRFARMSLLAFRRSIANKPELHTPSWAQSPVERLVRSVLLAGSWRDGMNGDKEVLSLLTGLSYDDLREGLARLKSQEDPLLTLVGGSWCLVSPHDAWLLLRSEVRPDDIDRFQSVALQVLGEVDPALELALQDRWKAPAAGRTRTYSGDLREGLAATLALLGVHGAQIDVGNGRTGTAVASYVVRTLLTKANEDPTCHLWASLADVLPVLTEAAPDAFLDGVRAGLQGTPPVLLGAFTDKDDVSLFGSSSPHTALLWALECLAWSPDHLGQAIDLLARLTDIDPGGKLANRPIESLSSIFCPWHPENSVSMSRRLSVFDALRQRHSAVAWRLGLGMLPELHQIHSPTLAPRYRNWKPPTLRVTHREYFSFVSEVVSRLIEDAGTSTHKWGELLDRSTTLPKDDWNRVREEFTRRVSAGELIEEGRERLWETLRGLIANHRQYAEANWALPPEELAELERAAAGLAPADPFNRHRWLFSEYSPDLGEARLRENHREYEAVLSQRRRDAVLDIEAAGGLDAVLRLATESVDRDRVGFALADALGGKYERELLQAITADESSTVSVALAFMARRFRELGRPWLENLLAQVPDLNAVQCGRLLEATRDFPWAWEVAQAKGIEVTQVFWRYFRWFGNGPDFALTDLAADALLSVRRPAAALRLVGLYTKDSDAYLSQRGELIIRILESILEMGAADPEFRFVSQHDYERAFKLLEKRRDELGWDRIAKLEWQFLPALGYRPHVPTLYRLLSTEPSFFVTVLSKVYRPKSEAPREEPSDEAKRMAENSYRLLSSWSLMPGVKEDGTVDGEILRGWVSEVLKLLDEANLREVGEIHIGHVLAFAPSDPNGGWPCVEVRDLLEQLQSARIESGLRTQMYNNRGGTSRAPDEGGAQERELAEKYRNQAEAYKDQWPRIAAILRRMAEEYEHEARLEDEEAERFRTGLDR